MLCIKGKVCKNDVFSYCTYSVSFNSLFLLLSYYHHHFVIVVFVVVTFEQFTFPFGAFVYLCIYGMVCMTFHAEGNVFQVVAACGMPFFSHNITNNKRLHCTTPHRTAHLHCIEIETNVLKVLQMQDLLIMILVK